MEDLRPDQPSWMGKIQDWLNFEEWLHTRRVWYGHATSAAGGGRESLRSQWFDLACCKCSWKGRGVSAEVSAVWFGLLRVQLHCNENPIYVFLFGELRGLSPIMCL